MCLSILGTWRGDAGEQWSSAHGISSVLISIQSLLSDKPYHNEPVRTFLARWVGLAGSLGFIIIFVVMQGFEDRKDDKMVQEYNE